MKKLLIMNITNHYGVSVNTCRSCIHDSKDKNLKNQLLCILIYRIIISNNSG